MDLSAAGTNRFLFAVDGEQNSADFTISVNGSAGWRLVSGILAASIQNALRTGDEVQQT